MKLWQALVATILSSVLGSSLAAALWRTVFDFGLPSYMAGMIGGMTAVLVWSFLSKYRNGSKKDA